AVAEPVALAPAGRSSLAGGGAVRSSLSPAAAVSSGAERYLDQILAHGVKMNASDIHVHAGAPIQMRMHGTLVSAKSAPLDPAVAEQYILEVLAPDQKKAFAEKNDLDFAYAIPGIGRFRGNLYRQRRGIDAVFRSIPPAPPTLEE